MIRKGKEAKSEVTLTRLTPSLKEKVIAMAKRKDRTESYVIYLIVDQFFNKKRIK